MSEELNQNETGIRISDIFKNLWKNKILIAIITAVIFFVGVAYTFFVATPKYSSKSSFIVAVNNATEVDKEDYDYTNSFKLVPTVVPLIKEEIVLSPVAEKHGMTANGLSGIVSVSYSTTSLLISVKVTHTDPKLTKVLADEIVEQLIKVTEENESLSILRNTITQTSFAKEGAYTSPNKILYLILALFAGLCVSFVVVFIKEFASNKFKTKEEVETLLDSKIIGFFYDDKAKRVSLLDKKKGMHQSFDLLEPNTYNYEPYNTLFTNVKYSDLENSNKVIMITSTYAAELKSTTISNLAGCIKYNNKKVVIIDLDMRKPTIHRFFKVSKNVGLVEYVEGVCSAHDIIKHTKWGVDVITSGKKMLNPVVIIEHSKLAKLIEELKAEYDYVLIDTPPVMVCSDALLVSKLCDGVIFNVTMNEVKKKEAALALESVRNVGARVIGVNVMKGTPDNASSGYYNKHNYYYYGKDMKSETVEEDAVKEAATTDENGKDA